MSPLLPYFLSNTDTSDDVWLEVGAGGNDVTFTADGGTTVATWANALKGTDRAVVDLKRDVPNNTVELIVDGVSKGTRSYSVPFPANARLVVGAKAGGDFLDGSVAMAAVVADGLSSAASETLAAIAAQGADDPDPTAYYDGDVPGCRWSGMAMASTSLRPAPGGQRMERIVADLEEKLEKLRHEGGSLSRWFSVGRGTFDVETVSGSPGDINPRRFRQGGHGVEFELEALPYMRGAPSVAGSLVTETTKPVISMVVDAPEGTVRALGSAEFGNSATVDRFGLVAGIEVADYTDGAPNVENYLEAEALTPINGASIVAETGAHGGSGQVVRLYGTTNAWQGGLTTQKGEGAGADLAHVGTFAVWARIMLDENSHRSYLRFVYAQGDLKRRQALDPVSVPTAAIKIAHGGAESGLNQPVLVKLGVIRLERPAAGQTARWRGEVQCRSASPGDRSSVDVDDIRLIPAGEAYAEIVSPAVTPPVIGAYGADSMEGARGLHGTTPDVGTPWVSAGAAPDFSVANGYAERSASGLRIATIGPAKTEQAATVQVYSTAGTSECGLVGRYIDSSNCLQATLSIGAAGGTSRLRLQRRVAGVAAVLKDVYIGPYMPGHHLTRTKLALSIYHDLTLWVRTDGRIFVFVNGELMIALPASTIFASGGALASGSMGIWDEGIGTDTRRYDNYAAWVPEPDAIAFGTKKVRWTYEGANRDDASSSTTSPLHVAGNHLLIPPRRRDGRKMRVVGFLTRGYPGLTADEDANPDPSTLQLTTTPRYLSVRR